MYNQKIKKELTDYKKIYNDKYWYKSQNELYLSKDEWCAIDNYAHGSGSNNYYGATGCYGFSLFLANVLFNKKITYENVNNSKDGEDLKDGWTIYKSKDSIKNIKLKPGDIIRTYNHSAVVWYVDNGTVTVAECFGSNEYFCKLHWGIFNGNADNDDTEEKLKNKSVYIIVSPDVDIDITITFDATGGTCETTSENHVVGVPYESLPIPTRNNYTFIGWWPERNIQSKQHTEETIVNRNEAYTLYAHWGSERKFANVGASTSTIKKYLSMQTDIASSGVNVVVRTDDGDVTQRWLRSPYNPAALKTTLAPNFGLSINDSNNSCIIRQVPGNEEDALIVLEDNGNGIYKIKLHKNNLYLTADANSNNVYWNEDSNSNYQLWHSESEISSIKVLDTYKVNNMSCPNLSEYSDELKSAICCAANLASYYDRPNEYCGCNLAEAGAIGESEILWNEVPAVEFITKPLDNYPSRIRSEICAERPVLICCSNNSGSDKHWVLATGYSGRVSTDDNIYVDDPNGAQFMSLAESMDNNNMTKVVSIMYTKAK